MNNKTKSKVPAVVSVGIAVTLGVCGALVFRARQSASAHARGEGTPSGLAGDGEPAGSSRPGKTGRPARPLPALIARSGSTLQSDPRAPDYDALKLAKVAELSFQQLHAAEPRDPSWAPAMEGRIVDIARKDFQRAGIAGQLREVECKTMVCKVVLEAPDAASLTQARRLFEISNVATATTLGGPEGGAGASTSLYIAFDKKVRDVEKNAEFYAEFRKWKIAQLKERHQGHPRAADEPPIPDE